MNHHPISEYDGKMDCCSCFLLLVNSCLHLGSIVEFWDSGAGWTSATIATGKGRMYIMSMKIVAYLLVRHWKRSLKLPDAVVCQYQ